MIKLLSPSLQLIESYLDFVSEMERAGDKIWESYRPRAGETHKDFVERLIRAETSPEPQLVPESIYWATSQNGNVVGRIGFRHRLNENLAEFGGHIGYEVRPSSRRQGIATEMLRLLLQTPQARAAGRLLLTCSPSNLGSIKTIVANGGILEKTVYVQRVQRETCHYWIGSRL